MKPKQELLSEELDKWTERRDWHQSAAELCERRIEAILGEIAVLRVQTIQLIPQQGEQQC